MNEDKQQLLLEYLISSPDTFTLCQGILNPQHFAPELRNTVKFLKQYYNDYHNTPDETLISAETGIKLQQRTITFDQVEYCAKEIEQFTRERAVQLAIATAPEFINNGDYATVENNLKDALLISLNKNLGVRYYDDVDDRLQRMLLEDPVHSTLWRDVDNLLFGGISRKELLLFSGNSGGGKSITLANLGYNFSLQNLNVLYMSLELDPDIIAQRYDTMITGVSRRDWKSNISSIVNQVTLQKNNGIIDIAHMSSGANSMQMRAFLKEYHMHHKVLPDLYIVDYLDKMSPNEKMYSDNVFEKDKKCSEQLRDIGVDHNMFVATASQLNRSAVNATEHDHSHIAGGISKINEADVYISILMTDTMKASGELMFMFQKTRNSDGVGKSVIMKWDNKHLRILDAATSNSSLTITPTNNTNIITKPSGDKLLELMRG